MTKLAAGGAVRIYTDAGELNSQIDSGQGEYVDVRHLAPGAYIAKQETADGLHEIAFVVDVGDEYARLPVDGGAAPKPAAGAGSPAPVSSGPVHEVREGVLVRDKPAAPKPAAKRAVKPAPKPAAKKAPAKKPAAKRSAARKG